MRIMVFVIYKKSAVYDPDTVITLSGRDITEADQLKYIENLRQTAKNAGIFLLAMIIIEFIFAATYLVWGKILLGLVTLAVPLYLLFLGKQYHWVFPIGTIICGAAAFISLLAGTAAPMLFPDIVYEITAQIFYISVPIQILMGLFFMYSKRINAHIKYIEHSKIYNS